MKTYMLDKVTSDLPPRHKQGLAATGADLFRNLIKALWSTCKKIRHMFSITSLMLVCVWASFSASVHAQEFDIDDRLNALEYIASYPELMNAFGTDWQSGANHYIQNGVNEGRESTFNACDYIASYPELINTFGNDPIAGVTHYIQTGRFENRRVTFSGYRYMAANPDVMVAYKGNSNGACSHYIQFGRLDAHRKLPEGNLLVGMGGKCIDVTSPQNPAGSIVVMRNCTEQNAPQQQWILSDNGQIEGMAGTRGLCITSPNFSLDNGGALFLYPCAVNNPAQRWLLNEFGSIVNRSNPNKCIDIAGASTADGAYLHVWDCWGGANQKWQVSGQKRSMLVGLYNNKCVDAGNGPNSGNGSYIVMWDCQNQFTSQHQWTLRNNGQIESSVGMCITSRQYSMDNGTPLHMYTCSANHPAQRWQLTPEGNIMNMTNTGKCIDISGASNSNGAPLQVWDCWGGNNQKWTVSNGLKLVGWTGKCLNAHTETAQPAAVNYWDCVGSVPQQQWVFDRGQIKGIGGLCLGMQGTNFGYTTPLEIKECSDEAGNGQHWYLRSDGNIASNDASNLCIDVLGWNTANGSTVGVWGCSANDNQKWVSK